MIDTQLLKILCCPETRQELTVAPDSLIAELNGRIVSGRMTNRGGKPVSMKLDGGLVRKDGKFLYPVRQDIPVMLIDEAVSLEAVVKA